MRSRMYSTARDAWGNPLLFANLHNQEHRLAKSLAASTLLTNLSSSNLASTRLNALSVTALPLWGGGGGANQQLSLSSSQWYKC